MDQFTEVSLCKNYNNGILATQSLSSLGNIKIIERAIRAHLIFKTCVHFINSTFQALTILYLIHQHFNRIR